MSDLNLAMFLVGAVFVGFFVGFAYMKVKLSHEHEKAVKNFKEFIHSKDADIIALKKDLRDSKDENKNLLKKFDELEAKLVKKTELYNILKGSMISLKQTTKEQKKQIKELESLILDIQNDFATISSELKEQKELNKKQKNEFEQNVEKLTQKANDLYMVKGTEDLKNAKAIFDSLREKSLNKI